MKESFQRVGERNSKNSFQPLTLSRDQQFLPCYIDLKAKGTWKRRVGWLVGWFEEEALWGMKSVVTVQIIGF